MTDLTGPELNNEWHALSNELNEFINHNEAHENQVATKAIIACRLELRIALVSIRFDLAKKEAA